MLRFLSALIGIMFIVGGVAGYMPQFMENGLLFGYFEVDNMHNVIHVTTGVIALLAATSGRLAKSFCILFGLIYAGAAVLGFWRQGDILMMHTNGADNLFYLAVGVVLLLFGISCGV